jgi:epoxyqueuosine reductase
MHAMDNAAIVERVMTAAGFDAWGLAPVEGLAELEKLPEWLGRGFAGEMRYMSDARRLDPRQVLPSARSIIVGALNYNTGLPYSTAVPFDGEHGWVSRYAWGADYHDVVMKKLEAAIAGLRANVSEPFEARCYVDTGPVLERVAAKYAGLGWLGKNTCLINEDLGSWLFLGVILTSLDLSARANGGPQPDLCGNCRLCIDACPTGAIVEPYVLDARRCISYLTIELRGSIPEEFRGMMGRHIFGCDICQDVCPWNRQAAVTAVREFLPRKVLVENRKAKNENRPERVFHPREAGVGPEGEISRPASLSEDFSLFAPALEWLATLNEEGFRELFHGSALKRARRQGILRNVIIAIGNSGNARYEAILRKFVEGDDGVLREAAAWGLARLRGNAGSGPPPAGHGARRALRPVGGSGPQGGASPASSGASGSERVPRSKEAL